MRHRRVGNQSEAAFMDRAQKQGWAWQRIADALELPSADAAEERSETLALELSRAHPDNNARPSLP
ncbi:hypothetical protein LX15_000507 [Streptoalloteichus tenebrarius]|uniref:Uncharacterized protein n=1 Tax=Streptoalloteichus tenebrarius (strain ATCC 17920 / DSM 40477 / JCM 4838 / CBS 697.72 / NBRC 16177 / NCIMB 11028 / NRRL B-12390 / A12253. 1 / ISP 5477) TaxID=1933 RepID=A0ABT1HMU7_STRSD|nr:hypothetical protein [Streptoalloteichus tenebrarius]